jgi:hypothetical protein
MLVRDVVARVGERVVVKQASLRVIQQLLRRIGVRVTQKADHAVSQRGASRTTG